MLEKNQTQLLTENEAAKLLKFSVKTLQARRMRGEPPKFYKLGRSVRYSLNDLDQFIESGHRQNTIEVA